MNSPRVQAALAAFEKLSQQRLIDYLEDKLSTLDGIALARVAAVYARLKFGLKEPKSETAESPKAGESEGTFSMGQIVTYDGKRAVVTRIDKRGRVTDVEFIVTDPETPVQS